MKTCLLSRLQPGVLFSLRPGGPIYLAGNRYTFPGRFPGQRTQHRLIYFHNGVQEELVTSLAEAGRSRVFLREHPRLHHARQAPWTVTES